MPLDPNILNDIGQPNQAVGRLASIFDPTVIQARQLDQARNEQAQGQIARANKLQQLLGGDPAQLTQRLAQGGFADEAMKYQGLEDAQQQRKDAEMARRTTALAGAHARIGAKGGTPEAIQEEYGALGFLTPEQIKSKVDWSATNLTPESRAGYFLDVSDPARITKREEAEKVRLERGEQLAADRKAREEGRLPDGMRMGPKGPEWVPGYIDGRARIAAAGANAGGVPMTIIQTPEGPMQVPTRGGGGAKPIVGPDGQQVKTAPAGGSNKMTEDQGKATGWLAQADNAYANMQAAMKEDPSAMRPTATEAMASKISPDAANLARSPARQKFMHGVESFSEAALRAATGAGVNKEEAIQKIRELTPGWTDSEALAKQKLNGLKVYMDSFKVRAGPGAGMVQMKSEAPAPANGGFKYLGKE